MLMYFFSWPREAISARNCLRSSISSRTAEQRLSFIIVSQDGCWMFSLSLSDTHTINIWSITSIHLVPTFLETVLLFFQTLVLTFCDFCWLSSSWFFLSRWHDILKPEFLFLQVSYNGSVKTRVISRTTDNDPKWSVAVRKMVLVVKWVYILSCPNRTKVLKLPLLFIIVCVGVLKKRRKRIFANILWGPGWNFSLT